MMRKRRAEQMIINLLTEEGEMTTNEIYTFVCEISFHGVTKNQLSNILTRSTRIRKVGFVNSRSEGKMRNTVWAINSSIPGVDSND